MSINKNKKSLTLDLKKKESQSILHDLTSKSDLLIHNMLPKSVDKCGLEYSILSTLHPSLLYVNI